MGYPISEPYWVRATVAGNPTAVLVQLFERRTLPSLPQPAGVAHRDGQVGQQYNLALRALTPGHKKSPHAACSAWGLFISWRGPV